MLTYSLDSRPPGDDWLDYNGVIPAKAGIQGIDKHLSRNFLTCLARKSLKSQYLVFWQSVFWPYGQFWQAKKAA
jgi:hypothetical protein